ncbi:methionyl-tRNA formyltransferase [Prochlorococcus marinus]|uniref:methionyl-tRNA formyltransferase n=1 Tax=Prochlorococcus marinus TaxID=1219 RepID=UPI001ADBEA21|nr:formyltransferase family protein [Prochlorococcus marinus]
MSFKIGYFADGTWAHNTFDLLIADKEIEISFLVNRVKSKDLILEKKAKSKNIPILNTKNVNETVFINKLKEFNTDLFVSMSFDQMIKKQVFEIPNKGTINCHVGKLPFYRGRHGISWMLINDEKEFGISVHYIDDGIDTGDLINQEVFPITDVDTYKSILERSYKECPRILYKSIKQIQKDIAFRSPQNLINNHGLYCTARKDGDEIIDWNQSSRDIFNFIRSISPPGPVATTFIGDKIVKITKSEFIENAPIYKGIPGAVLVSNPDFLLIKTKDSYLKITEWTSSIKLSVSSRLN